MKRWFLILSIGIVVLLAACAPQAAPSPTPAPAAPSTPYPAAPAPKSVPLLTPEDAAWAKVVEAAKKEGQVNAYAWGWTGDFGLAVAKAIANKYGIKVNIITGRGAEFIERIKTETRMGNITADFSEGDPTHLENMKLAGLLEATPELPVLRDKEAFSASPLIFSPEGYYLEYYQQYLCLHVNTNLVKPGDEPKAWVDLLDPKWKGKITFADPVVSVSPSYFAVLIEQKRLGLDFLEKLGKQDLLFDPSTPGVAMKLARGEAHVAYVTTGVTSAVASEGAPIKIIDTREGIFAIGISVGKVKGGPHPNATRLLLNWLLSQEGQDTYGKAKRVLSVRKDVPDYQHPAIQLKPQNPIFITPQYNDLVAKVFREKQYVPLLKPK